MINLRCKINYQSPQTLREHNKHELLPTQNLESIIIFMTINKKIASFVPGPTQSENLSSGIKKPNQLHFKGLKGQLFLLQYVIYS